MWLYLFGVCMRVIHKMGGYIPANKKAPESRIDAFIFLFCFKKLKFKIKTK